MISRFVVLLRHGEETSVERLNARLLDVLSMAGMGFIENDRIVLDNVHPAENEMTRNELLEFIRAVLDSETSTLADGGSILGESIRAEAHVLLAKLDDKPKETWIIEDRNGNRAFPNRTFDTFEEGVAFVQETYPYLDPLRPVVCVVKKDK